MQMFAPFDDDLSLFWFRTIREEDFFLTVPGRVTVLVWLGRSPIFHNFLAQQTVSNLG